MSAGHPVPQGPDRGPWLALGAAATASIGLMVAGAMTGMAGLTHAGGGLFLLAALATGGPVWRAAGAGMPREAVALSFASLIAAAWAWAGLAMLACYYLTDLKWQHAWQYGAGMLLIAAGITAYARARRQPGSRLAAPDAATAMRGITALQGIAALVGVVILLLSGKVEAQGRDWAANVVFIAGGLALFALSAMAVLAERRTAT
jgi:hypothetical protein